MTEALGWQRLRLSSLTLISSFCSSQSGRRVLYSEVPRDTATPIPVCVVWLLAYKAVEELQQRPYGSQSLKYWVFRLLQKMWVDPCSKQAYCSLSLSYKYYHKWRLTKCTDNKALDFFLLAICTRFYPKSKQTRKVLLLKPENYCVMASSQGEVTARWNWFYRKVPRKSVCESSRSENNCQVANIRGIF